MDENTKNALRKYYREAIKSIKDVEKTSEIVCSRIISFEIYQKSSFPALYWACGNEISLLPICELRWKNKLKFYLPRCLDKNGKMEFADANKDEITLDCRKIPSPSAKNIILPQNIDCIFVPGIAFDIFGNRLGQGAGYYDRYLKKCVKAVRIGVCFSAQISEIALKTDEHDEKMNFIISEKGVIKC
ncbi:MAG: 5-formyltetrahydrofolate cyclo-ligase [Chitinivibrionia bacterium]|nr:5-formyltetrahydrofolate cyclo-ligase [Chitinivibrionia bacterium]